MATSSDTSDQNNVKSRRPAESAFKQQRLPAWQPILTAGTVLPTFFVIGIAFIPVGIGLLYFSDEVKEKVIDYTTCLNRDDPAITCADFIKQSNEIPKPKCYCEKEINLTDEFKGNVFFYYGLSNYYQNHRRYVKSRDDSQLLGRLDQPPSSDCAPFAYVTIDKDSRPVAPCGAIANSLFNDTLTLLSLESTGDVKVPVLRTGIAWNSDKQIKFRNPDTSAFNGSLKAAFANYSKPANWAVNVWELDLENAENNGFQNEDLIVWMRTAALPTFRKLYRRVDHSQALFRDGLNKGLYKLVIEYNYPVTDFDGTKSFIISTTSLLGGKNPFLGVAYVVVGTLCLLLGIVLLIIHVRCSKRHYPTPSDSFFLSPRPESRPKHPARPLDNKEEETSGGASSKVLLDSSSYQTVKSREVRIDTIPQTRVVPNTSGSDKAAVDIDIKSVASANLVPVASDTDVLGKNKDAAMETESLKKSDNTTSMKTDVTGVPNSSVITFKSPTPLHNKVAKDETNKNENAELTKLPPKPTNPDAALNIQENNVNADLSKPKTEDVDVKTQDKNTKEMNDKNAVPLTETKVEDTKVGATDKNIKKMNAASTKPKVDNKGDTLQKCITQDTDKKSLDSDKMSIDTDKKSLDADKKSLDADKKSLAADKKSLDADKKSIDTDKKLIDTDLSEPKTEAPIDPAPATNVQQIDDKTDKKQINAGPITSSKVESNSGANTKSLDIVGATHEISPPANDNRLTSPEFYRKDMDPIKETAPASEVNKVSQDEADKLHIPGCDCADDVDAPGTADEPKNLPELAEANNPTNNKAKPKKWSDKKPKA